MISILTVLGIIFLGMFGGQMFKASRRFILPSLATIYAATKKKKKWKSSVYLLLMGILSMGYGENSKLRRLLGGSDFWTRIVYGSLVAIPFLALGKWWACLILPLAWSVRAGGFQITATKHFLWEDFIRYGSIGLLVVC